jgi:hypothetical protein
MKISPFAFSHISFSLNEYIGSARINFVKREIAAAHLFHIVEEKRLIRFPPWPAAGEDFGDAAAG